MKNFPFDRSFHSCWNARSGYRPNTRTKLRLNRVSGSAIQTILVPMDFSEASDQALDYALSLADCFGASIIVLHVVERTYGESFLDTPVKSILRKEAHDDARKRLDAIVESKLNCFAPIKHIVYRGVPQQQILCFAESMGVDLIVLGRGRRSLLGRWILGSVSAEIIDAARCPVLVVNAKNTRWGC